MASLGKRIFVHIANLTKMAKEASRAVCRAVLLVDELAPRDQWRVGRVESLGEGESNVRKAVVKLSNGKMFERHVTKLIALELDG